MQVVIQMHSTLSPTNENLGIMPGSQQKSSWFRNRKKNSSWRMVGLISEITLPGKHTVPFLLRRLRLGFFRGFRLNKNSPSLAGDILKVPFRNSSLWFLSPRHLDQRIQKSMALLKRDPQSCQSAGSSWFRRKFFRKYVYYVIILFV